VDRGVVVVFILFAEFANYNATYNRRSPLIAYDQKATHFSATAPGGIVPF